MLSEPSTFLLVNRYIIFNKFDKHIQLHMLMIYTGAISGQGPRPDINNSPGVTQIVPTFWPQHLFKFNSNNDLFPDHSSLGSDGRYTCLSLPLTVWWVPYLNKGCRPDFHNGQEVTRIMAPFWPSGVYLSPTGIMAPPRATPILCQMKYTSVQVSYL